MKEIYKNPILYFIITPVVISIWPLLVGTVYLPNSKDAWDQGKTQYDKAAKIMDEILKLDPERLDFADSQKSAKFDYTDAVADVASRTRIASSNYKISSGRPITSGDQKSQNAQVTLLEVDMAKFANFLSTLQLRWSNLQCTQVNLQKKKGLPDTWKVDLKFKYYF